MKNLLTSGHLTNNGGIRGHSAGNYFPWRVMAQGTVNNLTWWLISPSGEKLNSYSTAENAIKAAEICHDLNITTRGL